ncbi:MAG: mechanosensitive ion channel family protein [bacterium]|nr:mechanosensitive ion channel family protein [bacterium]
MLTLVVSALVLVLLGIGLSRLRSRASGQQNGAEGRRFELQWVAVVFGFALLLLALLISPIPDAIKSDIVQVLGIVIPAAVALSATAFLGNAMAGLVLRRMQHFRLGDFIRVGEHFGRVSERTLMHTEIQTEDRDLTSLPNLLLVTQPIKVVRRSGTVVSATVSLGYEIPWSKVEKALLEAATRAHLQDPFVQVKELGDFSVVYRTAGMLEEVRSLFTKRSDLRTHMLDCLHEDGIQILSPNYINLRGLSENAPETVPEKMENQAQSGKALGAAPTDLIFDKAESAAALDSRREDLVQVEKELASEDGKDKSSRDSLEKRRKRLLSHIAYLEKLTRKELD